MAKAVKRNKCCEKERIIIMPGSDSDYPIYLNANFKKMAVRFSFVIWFDKKKNT